MGGDGEPNVIKLHDHDDNLYIELWSNFCIHSSLQPSCIKKEKNAILITPIHKVNTVVFRRCLYFLSVSSIGDCYDNKKWYIG